MSTNWIRVSLHTALCMAACGTAAVEPRAVLPPGLYTLTTETVLPHLEEALRYATTRVERCLGRDTAESYFPVLQHEAFAGCSLREGPGARTFTLVCRNPEAATGQATFEYAPHGMRAVLELKMGGKNMTLSQRVSATRLGPCG